MKSDFGIIGLAVMGENIALNIENKGFRVSVFNRTASRVTAFMEGRGKGKNFFGAYTVEEFCRSLERPRKIMLMVKAGKAVDETIALLLPYLNKGDIIIDGGNSLYTDTQRRVDELRKAGILYVGSGISGGELGALHGPSMMPGGEAAAWPYIRPIFEAATAKVGKDREPCCAWIGSGGAGHFVKMVHNGIEYGDMQVICEAYDLALRLLKMDNQAISAVFSRWNKGRLESYLIEITADILKYKDREGSVVDRILDAAGQKGTGKWTAITALEEGVPLNFITEAVFARYISAQKELRLSLSGVYAKPPLFSDVIINESDIEAALYASKLISYAQGFELIVHKSKQEKWGIDPASVAKIWRGGCIIRSRFLNDIAAAYENGSRRMASGDCAGNELGTGIHAISSNADNGRCRNGNKSENRSAFYSSCDGERMDCQDVGNPNGGNSCNDTGCAGVPDGNLLLSDFYKKELPRAMVSLRKVVAAAALAGVPVACMSAALEYYDAICSGHLPANLLQAQRDYFGAHTYERIDRLRGEYFHTNWTGEGGDTLSSTYNG